jgi:outer membrane protein OmpA-like peptidoglycan-associated protein
VRPKAPTHIAVTPQSSTSTRITWKPSGGAIGYVVSIDGRIACRTAATVCRVPALVTPNEHVTVVSTGNARTVSDVARGRYANKPVLIAIVHFATGSSQLDAMAHGLLDATESKIAKGGFTHAMLTCHTDSAGSFVYNMALSGTRCGSVATYVKQRLGITHVTYRQAAYAFLRPAAPNSTRQGIAKNRRVEVWAK